MKRPNVMLLRNKACAGASLSNEMLVVLEYVEHLEGRLFKLADAYGVPHEMALKGIVSQARSANGEEKI